MSWMQSLSDAYRDARDHYPDEKLLLVLDIDGTISDMRAAVLSVLQSYDRVHGSDHFTLLQETDIDVHENHVPRLLKRLGIADPDLESVMDWYLQQRWLDDTVVDTHRPFPGVMPMIRWFQMQPNTKIGLLTGRPEVLRGATLRSLNNMGDRHAVVFDDDLLLMNPGEWGENIAESKAAGIGRFREMGYRVFAVIDNEPDILVSLANDFDGEHIRLLHADTIFESDKSALPDTVVSGRGYQLEELVPGIDRLSEAVQLVWHGVNDPANLEMFLTSGVDWAEIDIQEDPSGKLMLRHDAFATTPLVENEARLMYLDTMEELAARGASIKLDIKGGVDILDRVLKSVQSLQIPDDRLWFNGDIEGICEEGFRTIRDLHPGSIIQCPIGWLRPLLGAAPSEAHRILDTLADWGMNRYSVDWSAGMARTTFKQLTGWGFEVNFYGVFDLESFLEAAVLSPSSVTVDFNFPTWGYYGRGSGQGGKWFTYPDASD